MCKSSNMTEAAVAEFLARGGTIKKCSAVGVSPQIHTPATPKDRLSQIKHRHAALQALAR